ncbi:TIGR00375 family protein [[Eubacterium] cellulosolvens]
MIQINADLHIHSRFSISTSKFMTFKTLAQEAPKKGIHLVGTGDCLHPQWYSELKSLDEVAEGTFELDKTRFIPTVEVQGRGRVHHLILFPSLSTVDEFREKIKNCSKNLTSDGRPHVPMTGAELAELATDLDALIGPCHAFTPWTGLYGYFDTLVSCYGDLTNRVSVLELGLSANTDYADRLAELQNVTFLSNSDAHSPYPLRLGREFNQFKVQDITFAELKKAILRTGGRAVTLNVGLPPAEGKYNQSACIKCFKKYSLDESNNLNWKCSCGGRIKKGVEDRINELANYPEPRHPKHRPKYLSIIPLAEIISKALDYSSPNIVGVKKLWDALISEFGNEIQVLLNTNLNEIERVTNHRVANAVHAFRENKIIIHPGGGGKYGELELP